MVGTTHYRWNAKKPGERRWRLLRWAMTEEDAAKWAVTNQAEIQKVPGSAEERHPIEAHGMGRMLPPKKPID